MPRRHVLAFALFCLLSGSEWIVESAFPSSVPLLEQQSLHYLVIGLAACVILLLRRRCASLPRPPTLRLAAASVLLLGLPALLNEYAHTVSSKDGVGLFALVPLCIVVGGAAFVPASGGSPQGRALMMPSLIGFAGALLLLPFQLPSTLREGMFFAMVFAAVLLIAAGSLWMHLLLRGRAILPALAILCGANALLLGAFVLLRNPILPPTNTLLVELLRCILLDLPQLAILVCLLRELDPVRLASRFLFVPLLSAIEGVILLHLPIDLRLGIAGLLMAVGGGILLLANERQGQEEPSHLGLR